MRHSIKQHVLLGALATGIVISLGWFSERYTHQIDVTANQRNTLTERSVESAKALPGITDIIAVMGPNANARAAVTSLVARYQKHTDTIQLRFINPDTNPAQARELNAASGGELIIRNGENERRLQAISERALTGVFRQLISEGNQTIAFITGHEERSPLLTTNSDWGEVSGALARIGVDVIDYSLVTNPSITDDIDLVVIADPKRPYFPGEIASINDWLQRGGNLLWLQESDTHAQSGAGAATSADANSSAGASPSASVAVDTGLQRFADEFGVRSLPGRVIDAASQQLVQGSPTFVVLNSFIPHPTTRQLTSPILLPEAQAFEVTPLAGQKTGVLLQTSEASWTELGALEGEIAFDDNSSEVAGPLILGVSIERQINNRDQRVIIIGDADFGSSAFLGNGSNLAFIESLFLWLGGNAAALEFVTAPAMDAELNLNKQQIISLSIGYLAVLPLSLLGIAGFTVWRRRQPASTA